MATLQHGETARMYALGAVARGGATRGGYVDGGVYITIDGVHYGWGRAGAFGVLIETLTITDAINEAVNTCRFRINGTVPTAGAEIRVTLGSKNRVDPLFAGFALTIEQLYAGDRPANIQADVAAVDYTWFLGFRKVTAFYVGQSATAIAQDLVTRYAGDNGFTSNNIAAGLPALDQITFTDEELDQALSRLADRIGAYWYVDDQKDVHLFFDEPQLASPEALVIGHRSLAKLRKAADRTQVLTRVYVEGRGTTILGAVDTGDTMIPVEAIDMFQAAPDVYAKLSPHGSSGGAQHVTFSGVVSGEDGSLVGPGVGPPGPPTVAPTPGAGLSAGTYQYAYTDVTPAGETKPSPIAAVVVGGPLSAPAVGPTGTAAQGLGVSAGYQAYAYTYRTAQGGETLIGPAGPAIHTEDLINNSGGVTNITNFGPGGALQPGMSYAYGVTWLGDAGGESVRAAAMTTVYIQNRPDLGGIQKAQVQYTGIPPGVARVNIYRSQPYTLGNIPSNAPLYYIATKALAVPNQTSDYYEDVGMPLGGPPPTTQTAYRTLGRVTIQTPDSGNPNITGIKLYRSRPDLGLGNLYKLVASIDGPQGAVTYLDTTPDANLGPSPGPDTSATGYSAVLVSAVAAGPSPSNARRVYRTTANGAQLKLVTTLNDNNTTTYTDTTADAALGANAPVNDTSGLQQVPGTIPTGSTAIVVANPAVFLAAGGWAVIGNGEQVIRYHGKTATAITGVPPAGIGAITAAIAYNSTITAAPMITGIPTSGPYAIARPVTSGDDVNVFVQRDNTARQSDLAAMVKAGPGVREEWIQDRRLAIPEARARGDATLAQRVLEQVTVHYTCRDLRTASGRTIAVSLPAPTNITGVFKIQSVTISDFRPHRRQLPTYAVTASTDQFSFNDWLRRMETKA